MYFCLQTNNKVNIFALEIWDDEAAKCTFYTVKYDDAETNETDLFFEKYDAIAKYKEANQELLSFVLLAIENRFVFLSETAADLSVLLIFEIASTFSLFFENESNTLASVTLQTV